MKKRILAGICSLCLSISAISAFAEEIEQPIYEENVSESEELEVDSIYDIFEDEKVAEWDIVPEEAVTIIDEQDIEEYKDSFLTDDELVGATIVQSGSCGTTSSFTVYDTDNDEYGTGDYLVIYGTGKAVVDTLIKNPTHSNITKIKVEEGITELGKRALYSFVGAKTILLPASLEKIGESAFYYCTKLESVNIPENVSSIGGAAFGQCSSLRKVYIYKNAIPTRGTLATMHLFTGCKQLTSAGPMGGNYDIAFGWDIKIPDEAFMDSYVKSVVLPNGLTEIGKDAFHSSKLEAVDLPNTLTKIGVGAFASTNIAKVKIPGSVKYIYLYTFSGDKLLTEVEIEEGVKELGQESFYGCEKLEKIVIPKSVTYIADDAFKNCGNVKIYGYTGSYAETYANKKSIPFESVGKVDNGNNGGGNNSTNINPVNFADNNVLKRLAVINKYWNDQGYVAFTKDGKRHTEKNHDNLGTQEFGFVSNGKTVSWQCVGFVDYISNELYGYPAVAVGKDKKRLYYSEIGSATDVEGSKKLLAKAVPGDCIYVKIKLNDGSLSRHWMIFLGYNEKGNVLIYHANGLPDSNGQNNECVIDYGTEKEWKYFTDAGLCTLWHFNDYDKVNVAEKIYKDLYDPIKKQTVSLKTNNNETNSVSKRFNDVDAGKWYVNAIQYAVDNNIMSGTTANTFEPDKPCTRGMMVTILYTSAGRPAVSGTTPFVDLRSNWYKDAVLWAYKNGITKGQTDTTFAPDKNVSRQEMAVFLMTYAKLRGYDTSASADISKFVDVNQLASWATPQMKWANANGIINGKGGNKLDPKGNATRAEVAAMIMSFQNKFGK